MEHILRKFLQIVTFILMPVLLNGQTMNEQIQAFQESYLNEASGSYESAIDNLKSVYKESSYEVNLRLGYLCYLSGRFTESIAYYNNAINLMPFSVEARFGYVLPAAAMGNYSQVLNQYEKILEITPNHSVTLHRIGLIYYGRHEYAKAEKYFEKVVNLFPFDYDGLSMLAWTKLKLNKTREAKVLFNKALLNTPGGSSALEGLELLNQN